MGSLPLIEGVWLTPSSTTYSTSTIVLQDKSTISPSPLTAFQHRSANRSPVESPPVHKKALMRVGSVSSSPQLESVIPDRFFGNNIEDFVSATMGRKNTAYQRQQQPTAAPGKENKSILKGGSMNNGTMMRARRRVEFQPSVQVFHFDKVAGEHVGSENQMLSVEPKDRREFVNRTIQNKFRVVDMPSLAPASSGTMVLNAGRVGGDVVDSKPVGGLKSLLNGISGSSEPRLQYNPTLNVDQSLPGIKSTPRPLPLPQSSLIPTSEGYVPGAVDFNFFEDESRRLRIKFTIPLGDGVSATDVLVKANMTGNKVRVVASRTVRGGAGGRDAMTQREEFSERYLLPMEVDPYLITARLDGAGNLFVEAPIMTAERKKALAAEKQAKVSQAETSSNMQGFSL